MSRHCPSQNCIHLGYPLLTFVTWTRSGCQKSDFELTQQLVSRSSGQSSALDVPGCGTSMTFVNIPPRWWLMHEAASAGRNG